MSWQTYVDNQLLSLNRGANGPEPKLVEAAILSQNDAGVWAISKGYEGKFTAKEQADIRTAVAGLSAGNLSGVQAGGIRVRGTKFMFTGGTDRSIYGTKKTEDGRVIGVIIVKTKLAILVAEYAPPHQAGEATPVVENLADYLITTGY